MAGHRRASLLRVAWVVVVTGVAAAAVVVPLWSHAILPGPGDLGVGWCFLAGSLLALRRPQVAVCLGLGGVLWVAVGLAPLGPDAVEEPLARLALLPTALLACAAGGLSARRNRRLVVVAGAVALGMAAIGGAGAPRFALLGISVAVLIVPLAESGRPTATTAVQVGLGSGLVVVGLAAAGVLTLPAVLSVAFHMFVLAGGAVAVGWRAAAGVRLGAGLDLDSPLELGLVLGRALGTGEMTVVFPGVDGGWLDPAGRPSEPAAASYDVTDEAGRVLARTRQALVVEPGLLPDLHRFLRAAGDGARLRGELRDRAEELAGSRARLMSAADDERRRLVSRLEVGPLRRIERLADDLGSRVDGTDWTARTAIARRTLDELVGGLDPVDAGGGLLPALARLADAARAPMVVSGTLSGDLDSSAARAVWFACAEALANVRKHAPGSTVTVTVALDASGDLVLTVTDDGPGGADPVGTGLAGLADRLTLVGGSLCVVTSAAGTTLVVRVPARNDVLPLMPRPVGLATVVP